MATPEDCAFCDTVALEWRTIRAGELFVSFVSNPRFRDEQCLVVPRRHITTVGELESTEAGDVMAELGRLASLLDQGYGSGIMQKYQPLQAENGIKVSHLHFHVFQSQEEETGLFPVPEPNNFSAFYAVPDNDPGIVDLAQSLM